MDPLFYWEQSEEDEDEERKDGRIIQFFLKAQNHPKDFNLFVSALEKKEGI